MPETANLENIGGHGQIAHRHHKLAAGGGGDAVDAGDDRLRQAGDAQHQLAHCLNRACMYSLL